MVELGCTVILSTVSATCLLLHIKFTRFLASSRSFGLLMTADELLLGSAC